MTSLAALLGRPVAMEEVKGRLLERLMRTFHFDEMVVATP